MRTLIGLCCALAVSIAGPLPLDASELEWQMRSKKVIQGQHHALGVTFSSVHDSENEVVVVLELGDTSLVALIDYAKQATSIQSLSVATGEPVTVTARDVARLDLLLRDLTRSAEAEPGELELALLATLSLLSNHTAGTVVDISADSSSSQSDRAAGIKSLCGRVGKMRKGTYRIPKKFAGEFSCGAGAQTQVHANGSLTCTERVIVGPCDPKDSGKCLGRCGAKCSANPGNPNYVQRYTQDCLDHDLCTRATGEVFKPCRREFNKAVGDYVGGKDCMSTNGGWTDNFGFEWQLEQDERDIEGTVDVSSQGSCGVWTVTGNRKGATGVVLTARIQSSKAGCCNKFTYRGTLNCDSAGGTWTNVCGLAGTWDMTRSTGRATTGRAPSGEPEPTGISLFE